MKLIKHLILAITFFIGNDNFAQDSILPIKAQKILVDNIGNIYALNNDVITKYFTNKQEKTFSIKSYGTLESMDASNTLRVLLFFKDFQRILFLDSQLSPNGPAIELSELGFEQSLLVCSSFNNGFWIYNQANNELIRWSQNLEINVRTGNLKRLLDINIIPNFMMEHNGKLYLNSPNIGILVFDIYGAYLKTIPLKDLKNFYINYPYLFYLKDNHIFAFDLNTLETTELDTIKNNCLEVSITATKCFWLCKEYIIVNHCIK